MARLYSNENYPRPVVEELRRLGHDVLTARESDRAGRKIPDDQVLAFAISQGRAVLTLNRRHFVRLHTEVREHRGIIACTVDEDFVAQARRVDEVLHAAGDLSGKLIRVNRPAT